MTIEDVINEIITCNDLDDLRVRLKDYAKSCETTSITERYFERSHDVLEHLNTINGSKLRGIQKIAQRLSEGYSVECLKRIADVKVEQWSGVKKMAAYLKPMTLYGSRNKVDKYLDEVKLYDDFNKKEVAKSKPDIIVRPISWN